MDQVKIITKQGVEESVYGIFYTYNNKYYFIYTLANIDENGYVVLHIVQVGKEVKNTPTGPVDTGYMVGVEISNEEEWKSVQNSITKLVESKKNGVENSEIQYLSVDMLSSLKIMSSRTFKLVKNIVEQYFNVKIDAASTQNTIVIPQPAKELAPIPADTFDSNNISQYAQSNGFSNTSSTTEIESTNQQNEMVIDYRTKFFEEQETNKQLLQKVEELNKKIDDIKQIIQ